MVRLGQCIFTVAGDVGERQGVSTEEIIDSLTDAFGVIFVAGKVVSQTDQEQFIGNAIIGAPVVFLFRMRGEITGAIDHAQVVISDLDDGLPSACAQTCRMAGCTVAREIKPGNSVSGQPKSVRSIS